MRNELVVHVWDKMTVNYERRVRRHGYEICHNTRENEPMNFQSLPLTWRFSCRCLWLKMKTSGVGEILNFTVFGVHIVFIWHFNVVWKREERVFLFVWLKVPGLSEVFVYLVLMLCLCLTGWFQGWEEHALVTLALNSTPLAYKL